MADPFPVTLRPTTVVTPVIDEHGSKMLCRVWIGTDAEGKKVQALIAAIGFEQGHNAERVAEYLIDVELNPQGRVRTY